MGRRILFAASLALLLAALPATVLAHPLGNFTINHYAGITVSPGRVELDVVIDMAEIPTFEERIRIDADEDGRVSDSEAAAAAPGDCETLGRRLRLDVDGTPAALSATASRISFPGGLGGLPTLRIECGYNAAIGRLETATTILFADDSYRDRIGWREIVVTGDGASVEAPDAAPTSISSRLTTYPDDLLDEPLDMREATIVARADGSVPAAGGRGTLGAATGAVPGGLGAAELPEIFGSDSLSPLALLISALTAIGLGAVHALTPGHGKTLMAAYLVGTRGRPLHAVGLGVAVSISHTLGILVLATAVVGAQGLVSSEAILRAAPLVAAVTIAVIGAWMLASELRRRRAARGQAHAHDHAHAHEREHSHGGVRHSHAAAGSRLSWRSLGALGLAGGLIPSTSALFILLLAIELGRPAFGFVLVAAFGIGMAIVMAGIGVAVVLARGRVERLSAGRLGRVTGFAPLGAAVVVLGFGIVLSLQAILGPPTL